MRKSFITAAVLTALLAAGCAKDVQTSSEPELQEMSFGAGAVESKTALAQGGAVVWNEGDAISVFDGTGNRKFTTTDSGEWATFAGKAGISSTYYALYPFKSTSSCADGAITIDLPKTLCAAKGSFDKGVNVSVGQTSGNSFEMKNIFGLIKFSISGSNIRSVTLHGLSDEPLAGLAQISFNSNGLPATTLSQSSPMLTLATESGAMESGDYYLCVPPTDFSSGIELIFTNTSDKLIAVKQLKSPITVGRAKIVSLGTVDTDLSWQMNGTSISAVFIESAEATSFKWPFETPSQSTLSSSGSSPSYIGEEITLTLPQSKGGYQFQIYSPAGWAKNAGGSQGLKSTGMDVHVKFPVINGLALSEVSFRWGGSSDAGKPQIVEANGSGVVPTGGEVINQTATKGTVYTWSLSGTDASKQYMLQTTGSSGIYIQAIELTYGKLCMEDTYATHLSDPVDVIPDFSRVGYHWGEVDIPEYSNIVTLEAPSDGSDATSLIQNAINNFSGKGAILLKKGTYRISGTITFKKSNLVLRGEGTGTVLYGTGTTQRDLIEFGNTGSRSLDAASKTRVSDNITPVGQMFVRVEKPGNFKAGDRVAIFRPGTDNWIADLHMNEIPQNADNTTTQWTAAGYSIYWERSVTKVEGNKVFLDNPVVMELNSEYGGGYLQKCSWDRIKESGIESLCIDTEYTSSTDENHVWTAIDVHAAEHCWVRDITTKHMGYCCVCLSGGARNVTVRNCNSLSPISIITGSRRYAFHHSSGELCLFDHCNCSEDRHGCVCGARTPGPNVFYKCKGTNMKSDMGPHQRWSTGVLYDCIVTDGQLNVQDRDCWGTGHGWAGANFVLWNCDAKEIVCQSPWVSAKNYAFGCTGTKKSSTRSYAKFGTRPDGEWVSYGTHMPDESLYEKQLSERLGKGELLNSQLLP